MTAWEWADTVSSQKSSEEVTFQVELKPERAVIPGSGRTLGKGPRWDEGPSPGPEGGRSTRPEWWGQGAWSEGLKRAGALLASVRSWEIVLLALGNGLVEVALRKLEGRRPQVDMGVPQGAAGTILRRGRQQGGR